MKLLIVLGLFPLFSAQFFGSFLQPTGGLGQANNNNNNRNNYSGLNNNNNYRNNYNYSGSSKNNNNNLLGLDKVNAELVSQLRTMTSSLVNTLRQINNNPDAAPFINNMFRMTDSVCLGSMEEAIQAIEQGTNVASVGLVESTKVLDSSITGSNRIMQASLEAAMEALRKLTGSSQNNRSNGKY